MSTVNKQEYETLRNRARTDLYWLATKVLHYGDLVERVHRPVCDFFVHKDNTKSLANQDIVKERQLLDPRGHFKTSIDIADCVQWILNFPDIRINIMSGSERLVTRMLYECKEHFWHNEDLRDLFPEFCTPSGQRLFGNTEEFTVRNRTKTLREPTVSISTADSVKASAHYDLAKLDDLVHEGNVGTPDQIEKTITAYKYITPLIEPYGYRDSVGTRYSHSDLYGWEQDEEGEIRWVDIPFGRIGYGKTTRFFQRKVWIEAGGGIQSLLFPERFTVEWLHKQEKADPYIFSCQYLNDATPPTQKHFTEELLKAHTLPVAQLPAQGRTFLAWDLGFSRKEYSDYSVGAVGRFNEYGQLFLLDLVRGRFSPYELITVMLAAIKRWRPARMLVEKASGSELILPGLTLSARDKRIQLPPIDWVSTSPLDKKVERIAGLHPLICTDKLYFAANVPQMEDLIKEFSRFPKFRRNDIPDAISRLLAYRTCVDIQMPDDQIEFIQAPVMSDDGLLGAGLCG